MQYLDAANTQSIPAWTRFDAGVRYTFERKDGKPLALRFNVENLFDANYWSSGNATFGLSMGAVALLLYLIRKGQVSRTASLIYLIPPTVAAEAAIAFGEPLTMPLMVGTVIVAFGVYLTNRRSAAQAPRAVAAE